MAGVGSILRNTNLRSTIQKRHTDTESTLWHAYIKHLRMYKRALRVLISVLRIGFRYGQYI